LLYALALTFNRFFYLEFDFYVIHFGHQVEIRKTELSKLFKHFQHCNSVQW